MAVKRVCRLSLLLLAYTIKGRKYYGKRSRQKKRREEERQNS